jgi:hypothetical protein
MLDRAGRMPADSRVYRIQPDTTTAWRADGVAIDGVRFEGAADGIVRGSDEWDPPSGWRPFALRLDGGRRADL